MHCITLETILLSFTPVDGNTGLSVTNISTFDDGSPFNFSSITDLDAYINVHLSANDLGIILAQGNIGSNI